jgi:hypothetical protein
LRKLIVTFAASAAMALASATPAMAYHISPHRHFINTASGEKVYIGPNPCPASPSIAFDNFHGNVHRGTPFLDALTNPNNPVSGGVEACGE